MVIKWQFAREKRPSTGWLLESPKPKPEDVTAAFPVHTPDIKALQNASGMVPVSTSAIIICL